MLRIILVYLFQMAKLATGRTGSSIPKALYKFSTLEERGEIWLRTERSWESPHFKQKTNAEKCVERDPTLIGGTRRFGLFDKEPGGLRLLFAAAWSLFVAVRKHFRMCGTKSLHDNEARSDRTEITSHQLQATIGTTGQTFHKNKFKKFKKWF